MTINLPVVGNITSAPELKFSQAGKAWATFTIADNRKDGETEKATFVRCKAFGELAEHITESIDKGCRVVALGRLTQEDWETNGEKRSAMVLIVDAIGPDLRFATAKVTRTPKSGSGFNAPPADDPWASAPVDTDTPPF